MKSVALIIEKKESGRFSHIEAGSKISLECWPPQTPELTAGDFCGDT